MPEVLEKVPPKKKKKKVAAADVGDKADSDFQLINIQLKKEEENIPFHVKQNKEKLLDLLKRIQSFGVESYMY